MTTDHSGLVLLTALIVKHLVFDWVYQPPWMWRNKGHYGRLGGVAHSTLHGAATLAILPLFGVPYGFAAGIALAEALFHYHVDYLKMRINDFMGWRCDKHHAFWVMTGVDQTLHTLTYVVIAAVVYGN